MKTVTICNTKEQLRRQIELESASPEWQAGAAAFRAKVGLDMRQGQAWALGWLTARLQAETDSRA